MKIISLLLTVLFVLSFIPVWASQSTNYIQEYSYTACGGTSASSTSFNQEEVIMGSCFGAVEASSPNFTRTDIRGIAAWLSMPQHLPRIGSITPDARRWYDNESIAYTVNATDYDGDNLEYQFKLDGTIKQNYSSADDCNFVPLEDDLGRGTLNVTVRDSHGGEQEEEFDVFIYHSPEEP